MIIPRVDNNYPLLIILIYTVCSDIMINSFVCRGILPLLNAHIKVELNDTRVPTSNTPVLKVCKV